MSKNPTHKPKTLQSRILSGSVVLLSGSGLVTGISFAYNIVVARFLGPDGFGDATAVYTLLTLISAITLSFQIVSAKVVAQQESTEGKYAGYQGFHHGAWLCGIVAGLVLVAFRGPISDYLNLGDPVLVVLLAIGVAFYVPLGCRRGYLQGICAFRRLATNLVLEGVVRLGGSLVLILLGMGVRGVILSNSAAVAVAYFIIWPQSAPRIPNPLQRSRAIREASQAMVFFFGQVVINNCDIVLVKHYFLPEAAGLYAAVAMVGRVIYSFASAVVNSMFPLVAGTRAEERRNLKVIATSLVLVLGIGSLLALLLRLSPPWLWTEFFGAKFQIAGEHGLPYLLALYAIATVVYSLSAVIITYEMSYKISNGTWIQLLFSGVVIVGIARFHSSLREVILVQLVLMSVLFLLVSALFVIDLLRNPNRVQSHHMLEPVRVVRRTTEDEVISEFLKSDFSDPVFRKYYESLRKIVMTPNLDDAGENAKRRALFSIRHLRLWNEIPDDTEWYEVEVKEPDLGRIRVFPRGHWRKLGGGNFEIQEIVGRMREQPDSIDSEFLSKIGRIQNRLDRNHDTLGPVILIGINESEPFTILDGNHRLVAALVGSPKNVDRLRFICGLSPRMMECCWYNTNFMTLLRYGRNTVRHLLYRRKAQLARLLQAAG